MTPRLVAIIAAATSLLFGIAGLAVPGGLASAFGIELDPIATALVRLACAAYVGYGLLAWLVRDVTDPAAWRAVAGANAASWIVSAAVILIAVASGVADARALVLVVMQVAFGTLWSTTWARSRSLQPLAA